MKKILATLSLALLTFSLTACGGNSAKTSENKELVLFTWENMFPKDVLEDFTKETGIKIVYSNF